MSDNRPDPKAEAREVIDEQLKCAGWADLDEKDRDTGFKREYPTKPGC